MGESVSDGLVKLDTIYTITVSFYGSIKRGIKGAHCCRDLRATLAVPMCSISVVMFDMVKHMLITVQKLLAIVF